MNRVSIVSASTEEAFDGMTELWCEGEMLAISMIVGGRLCLRVDPRRDGQPWLIDVESLTAGLDALHRAQGAV